MTRAGILRLCGITVVVALVACVPLRLTTYSYGTEAVEPIPGRRVSLHLKPNQGGSLGPPPSTFVLLLAITSDSLNVISPRLLSTTLRGLSDTTTVVIDTAAVSRIDPSGRIQSLMHLSVPLTYQAYEAKTALEWSIGTRRDTLTSTWTIRPLPKHSWFIWPWAMWTDG